jgi:hypothetical protein
MTMKNVFLSIFFASCCVEAMAQHKPLSQSVEKHFAKASYINVHNCKAEFQCFDTTITDLQLDSAMSFMYRIGSKDRGLEKEFVAYQIYDFSKKSDTQEKAAAFAKEQVKLFKKSLEKLKKAPVPAKFLPLKAELLRIYTKRQEFEEIVSDWYESSNDLKFRERMKKYYSDLYILATLDKTLAIPDKMDKLKYTYFELYDIVFARIFNYEELNEIQNKLFQDYKIEVMIDADCKGTK